MISKKSHHILDYLYSCVLIISPYLFDMSEIQGVKRVFFWSGIACLANVMLTRVFPCAYSTQIHMKIDLLIGGFLILAPTIFSFRPLLSSAQYEVYIVLGFLFILLVGETRYRHESSIAGPKIALEVGHFH